MARELIRELSGWKLSNDSQDIRGRSVKTADGRDIGRVTGMIADTESRRVDTVVLDDDRQVPVEDIEIRGDDVFLHSDYPETATPYSGDGHFAERELHIPVIEEEIAIGKREVDRGGVRVRTEVSEQPVEEPVSLRQTTVHVERRNTDRAATDDDIRAAGQEIEVHETAEEPVIDKRARVVEEVVINKDVEERTETIRDTVRRSDVDVDKR